MKIWTSEHIFKWVPRRGCEENFPSNPEISITIAKATWNEVKIRRLEFHATMLMLREFLDSRQFKGLRYAIESCPRAYSRILASASGCPCITRALSALKHWLIAENELDNWLFDNISSRAAYIPRNNLASVCRCDAIGNVLNVSGSWWLR